jgi:hypothetical protein
MVADDCCQTVGALPGAVVMTRIKLLLIVAAFVPLLACGNGPDYDAKDDAACRKSFDPVSGEYRLCRQAQVQKREGESRTGRTIIESPAFQPSFVDLAASGGDHCAMPNS